MAAQPPYLFGFLTSIVGISFPGTGPTGSTGPAFVPFSVTVNLEYGGPLPSGGADQGPDGNDFQFMLGVWKPGKVPGVDLPFLSTVGNLIHEHSALITDGSTSFDAAYLPENSDMLSIAVVGSPGTVALLCYNTGTQDSNGLWHAQVIVKSLGAGGATLTSPLSPNIGQPQPFAQQPGDLGSLGGSVVETYAINVMPISFNFKPPSIAIAPSNPPPSGSNTGP